jgi:hypothetical protein
LRQICERESFLVKGCVRLLRVMLATYRPLDVREVSGVSGLPDDRLQIEGVIGRCVSFVILHRNKAHFVHQSARDRLTSKAGRDVLDLYDKYGHGAIAVECLIYLCKQLQADLLGLKRPNSSPKII